MLTATIPLATIPLATIPPALGLAALGAALAWLALHAARRAADLRPQPRPVRVRRR